MSSRTHCRINGPIDLDFTVASEELPSSRYWMGFGVKNYFRQIERVGGCKHR
jgi:hypothetical protein